MGAGVFVVLEGLDGAGKTTIAKMLCGELEKRGFRALYTYEPTDSEIVKAIKGVYSAFRDPYVDALAFALDRLIHVKRDIAPALERGYVVISDRYYYSSVAYQSAYGADPEWVLEVNKHALSPDIAIYLDIEPELSLQRKAGLASRFPEFEKIELLERVRSAYLDLVRRGLMIRVDAGRRLEEVYAEVRALVFEVIKRKLSSSPPSTS